MFHILLTMFLRLYFNGKCVRNSVLCATIPDNLKSHLFILYLAATIKTFCSGDFPGGPEVTNHLAMQGMQILSVSGKLRSRMPQNN